VIEHCTDTMRSPYANIKNKSPRLISNQHNIKGSNKEKELRNQNEKKKTFLQSTTATRLY